jgi:putative membrane protein
MKAAIVVPSLHPGPFKNVGSSPIPSLIQKALEDKLKCIISVPHGISGHELDLASQAQNEIVLNRILQISKFEVFHPYATPFLSIRKDDATAGCQVFGDCAFLTLTLSPETMEDLPVELNDIIIQEAKRLGLAKAVVVDAHNSILGPFNPHKFIAPIKEAVVTVLEEAVSCELSRFEVGAAKLIPTDFSIKEGIGPGGISIVVVKVGDQKTAYVTIDGNNMVSGLREKILSSIKEIGVTDGEIMTTDTQIVNAVVISDRGYHPVGEAIDPNRLVEYIKEATTKALRNLEPMEASWHHENILGVKVIGERQINDLSLMVDEAAKKAKKTSTLVFPALAILLTLLLVFL